MAKDVVKSGSGSSKFEPAKIEPTSAELEQQGASIVQGLSETVHPGGKKPRVIGIPEETKVDEYTGELTEPSFDYIDKLMRNRPEVSQPIPCEHPGTRHLGTARHFVKVPGREMHMPVCERHLQTVKKSRETIPTPLTPSPADEYMGGEDFASYPIVKEDLLHYRIHRAKEKKRGEFRDEKFAQSAGATPWTGRNKSTHGPGRAPRPRTAGDELNEADWKAMVDAGMKAPLATPAEIISRAKEGGGRSKVHLAHQALLHSLSTAEDGSVEPHAPTYFMRAESLGLNAEEAKSLIVPAIAHHRRINKTTSFVPAPPPTTQFKKVAEEDFLAPQRTETLAKLAGLQPRTPDSPAPELMQPGLPAPSQGKKKRDTRSE